VILEGGGQFGGNGNLCPPVSGPSSSRRVTAKAQRGATEEAAPVEVISRFRKDPAQPSPHSPIRSVPSTGFDGIDLSNQMFQKRNATQRFCDLGLAAGEAPADAEPAQVLSKFREDPEAPADPQTGVCYKISPKVCLCIKDRLAEQWAVQKQLTCLGKMFF